MVFESAVANGIELPFCAEIVHEAIGRGRILEEVRPLVDAIEVTVRRRRKAEKRKHRGDEVDSNDRRRARSTRSDSSRPSRDEGNAHAAFPGLILAATIEPGAAFEPGAIVGGQQDDRIVEFAAAREHF